MKKPGRKSAAELANFPATADKQAHPDACYSLADEAAEVWQATVTALPADWIGAEALPLLAAYCRVTVQLRRLGQLIHQAETGPDPLDLPSYMGLIRKEQLQPQTKHPSEATTERCDAEGGGHIALS